MPSDLISRFLGATDLELGVVHPSSGYHIYIRGADYLRVGELVDWSSLDLVLRFNAVGTWQLETSAESEGARLLTKQGGIIVTREIEGVETTIFSGSVSTEWTWTSTLFRAAGRSDDAILEEVAVRPTPSMNAGPFNDYEYVHTDQASSVMRTLISAQIANAPYPWNAAPINLGPDPHLGGTMTARGRFQSVLALLREIAATPIAGGLGFKVIQSDVEASGLTSEVYQPQDRTADVIFSVELGTAADYEDTWQAPPYNYVYILGDGLGDNRIVFEAGDVSSFNEVGRLIATVIDKRGVSDFGELVQAASEALAGAVSTRGVSVVPFDTPSLQYGKDYGLGDLVTISTRVGTDTATITEIEVGLDKERGAVIIPTLGNANLRDEITARHMAAVHDRLSNLERNWTVPPDSVDRGMLHPTVKPPIGHIHWLAGPSVPTGYLAANGQWVSRTVYAQLFAAIGTTWGAGDGSTTFAVPDLLARFAVGAGSTYALGQLGGAAASAVTGLAHTHPGHHSHTIDNHSHTIADHSHTIPDHNHSISDHSHTMSTHNHLVDIDHNHLQVNTQTRFNVGGGAYAEPGSGSGPVDHAHAVDLPALGTTSIASGSQSSGGNQTNDKTGMVTHNKTLLATNDKTGMVTQDKTGMVTNDDTATAPDASYTTTASVATIPPFAGLLPVIYAGV